MICWGIRTTNLVPNGVTTVFVVSDQAHCSNPNLPPGGVPSVTAMALLEPRDMPAMLLFTDSAGLVFGGGILTLAACVFFWRKVRP